MRRPVGVKRVLLFFRWTRLFSHRVATVATLPSALFEERFGSLGASWVFSFQPVLPRDYRPALPSLRWKLGQAINAVTGTRLGASSFFLLRRSFKLPPKACFGGGCATVRTLLRLPTGDAATLPAFGPWLRWRVSYRFFRHARPVSGPSVADRCPHQTVPECAARPAPTACADTDRRVALMV